MIPPSLKTVFYARLRALFAQHGKPDKIRIAVYEDDESLRFFRPDEQWPGGNAEHTATMQQLAADVERDFAPLKAEVYKIITSDYWRWLAKNKRSDNDASRAEFISR